MKRKQVMSGRQFRKVFKPIRSHKMPKLVRTNLYWALYELLVVDEI